MTDIAEKHSNRWIERHNDLLAQVKQEFRSQFGQAPSILAAAPGRVNLIGEHIDYNDGFVLPMSIERYVVIAAAPLTDSSAANPPTAKAYSIDLQDLTEFSIGSRSKPTVDTWGRYVEGVVAGFLDLGVDVPSFNSVVASNVPTGSGLSSSAALEIATATMLESITGHCLPPAEKALLCQQAEHQFAGVPCGIMDQFSSVFGKLNQLMLLDCVSQSIEPVAFKADEVSILIINSNVKHELSEGEYAQRRGQCEQALREINKTSWREVMLDDLKSAKGSLTSTQYGCAQHVITEIERTQQAAEAFKECNWSRVGELMHKSHTSLQKDYKVSCDELDILVELAGELGTSGGVYGSRMTGGGFGGCTVTLVKTAQIDAIKKFIHHHYQARTGIQATSFASRPAQGAHLIQG